MAPSVSATSTDVQGEATWSPADFLLHGRYCDTETIAVALERLRARHSARAAVLIAYRGLTVFRSLLLMAHESPQERETLQNRLVAEELRASGDAPPWIVFDPALHGTRWLVDNLTAQAPFDSLAELLAEDVSVASRRPDLANQEHASGRIRPAGIYLLLAGAERDAEDWDRTSGDALDGLLHMVNASAPAVVHGNLGAEHDVQRATARIERTMSSWPLPGDPDVGITASRAADFRQALLEEALALTGSSVGNIYFVGRDADALELAAAERNARPLEKILVKDQRSVVAWVYSRGRPMVINDIRDFERMHPSRGARTVTEPGELPYAELAVPVMQAGMARGGGRVVGVLNVEKVEGVDDGYYTYRDLNVLRMLAARLSMWRQHALLGQFSRSLTHLTRRNTVPVEALEGERDAPSGLDRLPADAWHARPAINETLERIYELTSSHSVTVRLLSSGQRLLIRFAAYPPQRLHDPSGEVKIGNRASINAWVARNGRPCYIENLQAQGRFDGYDGLEGYLDVREDMRSELCLPIFVANRLVGTLNLESRHRNAYEDSLDVAGAVCEQVGLAVMQARRAHEQAVMSMSVATTANVHELIKCVDKLRAKSGEDSELIKIADDITELIDRGAATQLDRAATTREIVDDLAERLGVAFILSHKNEPPVKLLHSGAHELILRVAFEELLRNAHAEALRANRLRIEIGWSITHMGGKRYLTTTIANPLRWPLPSVVADTLFRAPIRDATGRLHIGAFSTGALVRSIGGDVYVVWRNDPAFAACLDVPIPDGGTLNPEPTRRTA